MKYSMVLKKWLLPETTLEWIFIPLTAIPFSIYVGIYFLVYMYTGALQNPITVAKDLPSFPWLECGKALWQCILRLFGL